MTSVEIDEKYERLLFSIPLFRDLKAEVKAVLLRKLDYRLYRAGKGEVIIRQGDLCNHLCILLEGKLDVNIIDYYGNEVLVEYLEAPRAFATPHLFSDDNRFPATFGVIEPAVLMLATRVSTFKLISEYPSVLKNFLCVAGRCNACTTVRLDILSMRTIRERVIVYLHKMRRPGADSVRIAHTLTQLADYLNVSRPALSAELGRMEKEGLIKRVDKSTFLLSPELQEQPR